MAREDGGSAFPKYFGSNRDLAPGEEAGMSLRDYFAAVTLQGLVEGDYFDGPPPDQGRPKAFAERAYQIADAMLAERGK